MSDKTVLLYSVIWQSERTHIHFAAIIYNTTMWNDHTYASLAREQAFLEKRMFHKFLFWD